MGRKRLGRGLDSLLGDLGSIDKPDATPSNNATAGPGEIVQLKPDAIEPNPFQPRRSFDPLELAGLVESLQQHGMLQPVVVRQVDGHYQLVAGERRLRAAQEAGLTQVQARVVAVSDQQVAELAIVENLQRSDLNAIDKARAFRSYVEKFKSTQEELASRVGLDRSTVSNFVRLLELPPAIQQAVELGKITQGHARAILACNVPARQHELSQRVIKEGLSVRQIEALVAGSRPERNKSHRRPNRHKTSHVVELESLFRERFGTQVEIKPRGKDSGQIVIEFGSNDDFERIVEVVLGSEGKQRAAA